MGANFMEISELSSKINLDIETAKHLIRKYDIDCFILNYDTIIYTRYMKDKIIKSLPLIPIPIKHKKPYFEFKETTLKSKINYE